MEEADQLYELDEDLIATYGQQSAEAAIRQKSDLFINLSYKEYVYGNSLEEETDDDRRSTRGI